jgi:2,4-dienoyl-CoA reductase-like NADH-dependent reductase (Old Yellow Enzyme family)
MTNVPGIWTEEQVEAWKKIVSEVKATGAVFVAQCKSIFLCSWPERLLI